MNKLVSIALAATLSMGLSAHTLAKTEHVAPHGFTVSNSITVAGDGQKAWQALVNDVDKWWPKDHTWWGEQGTLSIADKAGGCFCEIAGDRSAEHMRISFVEPGKLLRMTGGLGPLQGMGMFGALDWQFTPQDGNKTQITLRYQVMGSNPEGYASLAPIVDKVQGQQLQALGNYVK